MSPSASPIFSVVTPAHYRPGLLEKLLSSLMAQAIDHKDFEVIIVGAEDDPGKTIVKRFAAQADFPTTFLSLTSDPWAGKSAAAKRNFGVDKAKGAWIAFIDDDCEADPLWLSAAKEFITTREVVAVEGRVMIPAVNPPTLSYKGLKRLEEPGGFQTCNMFYRRDIFREVGGFDLNFPFYMEDSDLAWTIQDRGHEIPYCDGARISHPVGTARPWKLLDNAKRIILVPYLYKKHPDRFQQNRHQPLGKFGWLYLLGYLGFTAACLTSAFTLALMFAAMLVILGTAQTVYRFRSCSFTAHEFLVTYLLTIIFPLVGYVQLVRGMIRYRQWVPLW